MKYQDFIDTVQACVSDESLDVVVRGTRVALSTLGSVLSDAERRRLAPQLPTELRNALLERERAPAFDIEEFYNRVSARASLGYPRAVRVSGAVMIALARAVGDKSIDTLRHEVPESWRELFEAETA